MSMTPALICLNRIIEDGLPAHVFDPKADAPILCLRTGPRSDLWAVGPMIVRVRTPDPEYALQWHDDCMAFVTLPRDGKIPIWVMNDLGELVEYAEV